MVGSMFEVDWKDLRDGPSALKPVPSPDEIDAAKIFVQIVRSFDESNPDTLVEFEYLVLRRVIQSRLERKLLTAEMPPKQRTRKSRL